MNAVLNGADWQVSGAAGARKSDFRGRMIVTVAPDENPDFAEQLVRAGRRYATALDLDWAVVCVETPPLLSDPKLERDSRLEIFRLAESLGAETVTLDAAVPAVAVAAYAKLHGIQTIVVGAAGSLSRRRLLRRSTMASLVKQCGGAEIIVSYPLINGCHACQRVGVARYGWDFDATGKFLRTTYIPTPPPPKILPKPRGQQPPPAPGTPQQ